MRSDEDLDVKLVKNSSIDTFELLKKILDCLPSFAGVLAPDGTVLEANSAALQAADLERDQVIGKSFPETYWWSYSPETQAQLRSAIERAAGGEASRYQVRIRLAADTFVDTDFAIAPIFDDAGQVMYLVPSGIDVTDRTRVHEQLSQSQAQFASIISSAMDAIITIDQDQRIVLFNSAAETMFECTAEEAMGRSVEQFIPEQFRASHSDHIENFGRTHVTRRTMGNLGAIFGLRSNGEEFPIEASISHAEVNGRRLYSVIIRDITERKRSEDRLRQQAALLDHAQDAILVRDLDARVLFWNRGAERLYGWKSEEVIGHDARDLMYGNDTSQYDRALNGLREAGEWEGELHHLTKDGKPIIVESRWTLVKDDNDRRSVLVINTDVTGKKRAETQLLRAQRMESIGTLAGGIAHDFNNLLSPILMSIRLLHMKATDDDSRRILTTLQASVERGAGLVKQVLSFARGVEGERINLQPRHLIREIVKILKDTLPKSIDVVFESPEDLSAVSGDPTQLHQVIMNLCVNARDAMGDGGKLTIRAENCEIDEAYARMNLEARPGRFVLITISDTGSGIPANIVDKIFEPFFTTKAHGQGTGLGLSTALGIVKSHGGFIGVYSEPGRGTTFKIYLPAINAPQRSARETDEARLPAGNQELILIVDDEAAILEITREALQAYNYRVLTAADGTEAVALFAQHKDEVRVVVTDMMMPFMDGPATIRALQKMNPRIDIIATSGFSDRGRAPDFSGAAVRAFLTKPYTADQLLNALATILHPNHRGTAK